MSVRVCSSAVLQSDSGCSDAAMLRCCDAAMLGDTTLAGSRIKQVCAGRARIEHGGPGLARVGKGRTDVSSLDPR